MTRFDNVFQTDGARLLKYITSGLVMAAVGLAIMIATNSIRSSMTGTYNLVTVMTTENQLNFWSNFIGYAEYMERQTQITQAVNWIVAACFLIKAVGQIAVVFGLVIALLGFLGCAFNSANEDKMRLVCMISGCVIIFVLFMGLISV
ncbi:MAG: hypothetical protein Q6373_010505 [Candidatus Sigynarchaeota archaeon]